MPHASKRSTVAVAVTFVCLSASACVCLCFGLILCRGRGRATRRCAPTCGKSPSPWSPSRCRCERHAPPMYRTQPRCQGQIRSSKGSARAHLRAWLLLLSRQDANRPNNHAYIASPGLTTPSVLSAKQVGAEKVGNHRETSWRRTMRRAPRQGSSRRKTAARNERGCCCQQHRVASSKHRRPHPHPGVRPALHTGT